MKIKFKNTILLDFLLGTIIVITILFSMLTFSNISNQKNAIINSMSENISSQSTILKSIAKETIKYGNIRYMQNMLTTLYENSIADINKLTVYKFEDDNKIKILSTTDYQKLGEYLENDNMIEELKKEKLILRTEIDNKIEYYKYIFPLYEEDRLLGAFEYVITSESMEMGYKKALVSNISIAIIGLVIIIIFTTLLLYFRIYMPITELTKEVRKIKDGQLSYDVKIRVNNELGDLAKEINLMKTSIWENSLENRMANPLTGLKGLMETIELINEKIENGEMFGVISIYLKNIEPYRIKYGLNSSEAIITIALDTVQNIIEELNISEYALTQLSENNFIFLCMPEITEDFSKKFVNDFDMEILSLYKQKSENGMIKLTSKDSEEKTYPMVIAQLGILINIGDMELKNYKDIEDKILDIEEAYYEIKENSFYVMYTKDGMQENGNIRENISDMEMEADELNIEEMEESDDLELSEDLLSGLEEL